MSNFPNIILTPCIPTTPPPPDPRCADKAFALANPGICSTTPVLILKPSVLLTCSLGSVQFKTFLDQGGVEKQVMTGVVYSSSNNSIALVSASTGNATGIASGEVTITATYQGLTATASLTVVGSSGQSCCDGTTVATMLVVDTSKSMSLNFGGGFATRMDYAKSVATTYANQTNTQKDIIGLISFNAFPTVLVAPTSNIASVATAIAGLSPTSFSTSIGLAIQQAMTALELVTADLKVIVVISDGENEDTTAANDPVSISEAWQSPENVIIGFGVRSSATTNGFNLLNAISTGGFFVNSYPAIATTAPVILDGLKGYICAGNCTPPGNIYEAEGALNYTGFANWNVLFGEVDLFGPGLFDLLPNNGLYVNMESILFPNQNKTAIQTKNSFNFVTGKTYRLSLLVAGNQTTAGSFGIQASIITSGNAAILQQQINITDYTQDFQTFSFNFTVPANISGFIFIGNISNASGVIQSNALIDDIILSDVTDLITMFEDNFDTENIQFVPPACGAGASGSGTQHVPLPAKYETSSLADVTGLVIGRTYTYTPQNNAGDYAIDYGSGSLDHAGTFVATQTTATLAGFADAPILDTLTFVGAFYYYGYNCYGYGCLDTPPGDQMPDPTPLPDIEGGFVAPTSYTATQSITVYCPNGSVQNDGLNTGATGTATYTSFISQQDAVNNAVNLATANANTNLATIGCKIQYTSTQSFTATCLAFQFGSAVTKSATATSFISQTDADALALAAAMTAANAALSCNGSNNQLPITGIGPAIGPATPYPSVQNITGKTGLITGITVNINALFHQYVRQLCVLLRSPSGRTVVLFSGMGGPHVVGPINFLISDAGATVLPDFTTPVAGTFKPSPYSAIVSAILPAPAYGQQNYWPSPAPQPSYGLTMATFIGDTPNGSWSLWVSSPIAIDTGSIGSWSLNITSV